jgi:hypothetical protein
VTARATRVDVVYTQRSTGNELRGAIAEYLRDLNGDLSVESETALLWLAEYRDWMYVVHPEFETRLPEGILYASMFADSRGLDATERDAMRAILSRVFGYAIRRHGAGSFHDCA